MPVPTGQADVGELAALYATGLMPSDEAEVFESRLLAGDAEYVREFNRVRATGDALLRAAAPPVRTAPAPAVVTPLRISPAPSAPIATTSTPAPNSWRFAAITGWLAAAAGLALAGWLWRTAPAPVPTPPQITVASLLAQPGTISTAWGAWPVKGKDDAPVPGEGTPVPGAESVTGRVVWNTPAQKGFVEFQGLPVNSPGTSQYQLWIIDADQAHPIDGGVFDSAGPSTTVAINPKIAVSKPVAFAVTVEKPGGVVVTDQKRRVVVAMAPKDGSS